MTLHQRGAIACSILPSLSPARESENLAAAEPHSQKVYESPSSDKWTLILFRDPSRVSVVGVLNSLKASTMLLPLHQWIKNSSKKCLVHTVICLGVLLYNAPS